ncbi:tumor necrosis factor ligand superfamily member 6-like [Rana temporaria]|uniref:tumor necrosis factor ligand superfamily member 6-like n=1 Tax=Rana temporaria TaxID=8407 RepID=UPI001AAC9FD3|nr:tumor necrosis factor ligand superfamily member 6-like [Rana temporaria]
MDRYVTSPMSVFTVEEPGHCDASRPPPGRRRASCNLLMQLILLLFALLALCGVASQIYYLSKVQAKLEATQEMVNMKFEAQQMRMKTAFRDGQLFPSAHLTGLTVKKNTSLDIPLQWESAHGLAFLHEMEYSDGSLRCKKSGLYFVYSKLQLGVVCEKVDPSLLFTHSVKLRTMGSVTQLMVNSGGFCNNQGSQIWKKSSFLGSSFLLEEGDEIFVNMSDRSLLRAQLQSATFFGLFML